MKENRQVSQEEGQFKANNHNVMFIETSARTGYNVKRMFLQLASALPPSGNAFELGKEKLSPKNEQLCGPSVVLKSAECESECNNDKTTRRTFCAC